MYYMDWTKWICLISCLNCVSWSSHEEMIRRGMWSSFLLRSEALFIIKMLKIIHWSGRGRPGKEFRWRKFPLFVSPSLGPKEVKKFTLSSIKTTPLSPFLSNESPGGSTLLTLWVFDEKLKGWYNDQHGSRCLSVWLSPSRQRRLKNVYKALAKPV